MRFADEPDVLPHDGSSLGHFDSSRRTIVVMHGFSQNGYDSAKEMRDGTLIITKHFKSQVRQMLRELTTRHLGNHEKEFTQPRTRIFSPPICSSRLTSSKLFYKFEILFLEFNKRGDFNVIFIEWGPLASWENYFRAAQNALNVGDYTAEFLANLMQASGLRHEVRKKRDYHLHYLDNKEYHMIGPPTLWIQPGRPRSGAHGQEACQPHWQEGGQVNR